MTWQVWPEEPSREDDDVVLSAVVEDGGGRRRLWYRYPVTCGPFLADRCDGFAVALLFGAMAAGKDLRLRGSASASLLRNLEEFQAVWARWCPDRYRPVGLEADAEPADQERRDSATAVCTFSGGLDSCFTAWRHTRERGRRLPLGAGLFVHGLDIPLDEPEVFARAAARARAILDSVDVPLIPAASNVRAFLPNWEDGFAAAVCSCLHLLARGYGAGLVAASAPVDRLVLPWGSNPVSDPLLSAGDFPIVHDGAALGRAERARALSGWPEAVRHLRVCWQGPQKDRNCGRCEKCIRTILCFRAAGAGLPPAFEADVSEADILGMRGVKGPQLEELRRLLWAARRWGVEGSWVGALERAIARNERSSRRRRSPVRRLGRRLAAALGLR